MTGYQEAITDPSYAGQILAFTYPLIGNYEINDIDNESTAPALLGLAVSQLCSNPDNNQAKSIIDFIRKHRIPTIYNIDIRELTKIIRRNGEVYGKITPYQNDFPSIIGHNPDIIRKVSTNSIKNYKSTRNPTQHIIIIDFGYKRSILKALLSLDCEVTIAPYYITPKQLHL